MDITIKDFNERKKKTMELEPITAQERARRSVFGMHAFKTLLLALIFAAHAMHTF